MDSIRAVMPRTAAKGTENGDNPESINLAALEDFMKTMQKAQSKGHIWRGRRTGLLIDDRKVTKNENGRDNIDSFWENAYLDSDESSPPSGASSVVGSPASAAEDASWAGVVGDFEAASGRGDDLDAEDTGNDAAVDGEGDSGPAKRLEYRPPPKSPMRSEVSTDEELVTGGKAGVEGKRNDADADDDDTETDGDQQQEQKQKELEEEQKQKQLQEEQKQKQEQQKQKALEEQNQKELQEQEQKQKQLQEEQKQKQVEEEQKQKQLEEEQKQKQLQEQKQKQQQQQQQQQQPADAADAAAGGEGGESTPKRTPKGYPGSTRSARGRGGSSRGKGKGRGAVGAEVATPMSVSGRGEKDDVNLSEAVGTRSGGKGWRKQGHDDTSSDDDDGEGWGGGDGGGWTFDDIGEDEGNANHDADGVPRAMSLSPQGGNDGSGGKEPTRRRMSSRASSRAKTPVLGYPPSSPSSLRRSGVGDRVSMSPGGSESGTRASISRSSAKRSNARKGLKTPRKTPASPASGSGRKWKSKGKGKTRDKGSEGGDSDNDDEKKSADVHDGDGEEALLSSPANDDDEAGAVNGDVITFPVTRRKSKAKKVGGERSTSSTPSAGGETPAAEENESGGGKRKGKEKGKETRRESIEKEVVVTRKREKKDRRAGKARAFASPGPPRSKDGPLFVDISEVSQVSETPGKRRSRRHRVAPLKFWKGDNILYGLDEKGLPVAEGIVKGPSVIPTLSRKRVKDDSAQGGQRKRARLSETMTPLKPSQLAALPKGKYMEKEQECIVWDEYTAATKPMHMVMRSKNYVDHELPATLERPPGKEKVGRAAQAFYSPPEVSPNYLTGRLVLPPGGIKDSEHVAYSNQVYVFTEGQPNALEFAIAMPSDKGDDANIFDPKTAQRFLLSPGDQFRVPMNNIYRLENHSEKCEAVIFWFIIKSAEA